MYLFFVIFHIFCMFVILIYNKTGYFDDVVYN